MGWNGKRNFGLFNSSTLMQKFNAYTDYARQYTYSKHGRRIPITVGIADTPFTFDNLMRDYSIDVFSLNVFRGVTTTSLFSGVPNVTAGFQWLTCAYNKPLLISEFGFTGANYKAGSMNQLYYDFILHYSAGLIGAVYFEYSDEAHKQQSQMNMGSVSVRAQLNGTQNSTDPDVFLPDIVIPKQQFYDLVNGTYRNIAYNFNTDPFALIGRSQYTLGSSVDECETVGNFIDCPGKESPACSGHGRCDRTLGYCNCSSGWSGADCSIAKCPGDPQCHKAGNCSTLVSPPECVCDNGLYGETCSLIVPSVALCPNNCANGNGICNVTCECHAGWADYDCSKVHIPEPFPVSHTASASVIAVSTASSSTTFTNAASSNPPSSNGPSSTIDASTVGSTISSATATTNQPTTLEPSTSQSSSSLAMGGIPSATTSGQTAVSSSNSQFCLALRFATLVGVFAQLLNIV